mgnify:CR=1 FL=1|tara:strand:- start:42 stop:551 length:510 start_codon:yes stop_codon:yes gene_type:complete
MKNIKIEKINNEEFFPFGHLIEKQCSEKEFKINQGTTKRFHQISKLDLDIEKGEPSISIFQGNPRPKPILINIMEKHPLATQTFLPIQNFKWLTVVALEIGGLPDLRSLRCFALNGTTGLTYNKNIWHHPLLVLKNQDFWVVDRINDKEDKYKNLTEYNFNVDELFCID